MFQIPSVFRNFARKFLLQAAERGSAELKFELPGFGYVDQFVRTYCSIEAEQRGDYLKHIWASDPHCKALKRYGGIEKSNRLLIKAGASFSHCCSRYGLEISVFISLTSSRVILVSPGNIGQ